MITFEIYGVGFELSLGEIDKSKFEYWKDREISEEDASNKNNKFNLFRDHWTDLNDIFHDNGPAMLENTKLEVKENDKIILETYLGVQDLSGSKINFKENTIKIDIKNNEEDKETFGKFSDIFFDHYESDNQITFFVPNDEEQYTLNELTDILI